MEDYSTGKKHGIEKKTFSRTDSGESKETNKKHSIDDQRNDSENELDSSNFGMKRKHQENRRYESDGSVFLRQPSKSRD